MSNPYTGSVTSALRKAQLLLGELDEDALNGQEGQGQPSSLARTAVREGVVLQLWRAYRAFLAEQAFQLNLDSEPESAQALAERAAGRGISCGLAVELQELTADPDSWLAQLQAAWVQLWSFSADSSRGGQARPANLIPAQNLSAVGPVTLSDEGVCQWHTALRELVQRQRAQSEEW
jgi:hypothetical protein